MSLYALLFYVLGAVILAATAMALTRRTLMHGVIYLVNAFVATGLLFYLLGAPLLAAFEVIIYAGAIMVLFLFIVMFMQPKDGAQEGLSPHQWIFPAVLAVSIVISGAALILSGPGAGKPMAMATASPRELGRFVFDRYWLAVEVVSFLLFIGLAGAYYLGRDARHEAPEKPRPAEVDGTASEAPDAEADAQPGAEPDAKKEVPR